MRKISACIISYNEEAKIDDCLASLAPVVDEIVVVDSNSTDRTVEIASRYTKRVIPQAFLGYVAQKQLAISLATHDWVLVLDCDERVTPELAESIRSLTESEDDHSAYEVPRKTFYVYRWLNHCWYPEWRVRLFDRRRCEQGGTEPHDKVIVREGSTGRLRGDLLHYSFDSLSGHVRTLNSFTSIAARELVERRKKVTILTPFTHAFWICFKLYILRRGFLDGFAGFCVAMLSGVHVFVKYAKVLSYREQVKRGVRLTGLE